MKSHATLTVLYNRLEFFDTVEPVCVMNPCRPGLTLWQDGACYPMQPQANGIEVKREGPKQMTSFPLSIHMGSFFLICKGSSSVFVEKRIFSFTMLVTTQMSRWAIKLNLLRLRLLPHWQCLERKKTTERLKGQCYKFFMSVGLLHQNTTCLALCCHWIYFMLISV